MLNKKKQHPGLPTLTLLYLIIYEVITISQNLYLLI